MTLTLRAHRRYISPPTVSQHAAAAAFDCEEELQTHLRRYAANREARTRL